MSCLLNYTFSCEIKTQRSSTGAHRGSAETNAGRKRPLRQYAFQGGPARHPRYRGLYERACACMCVRDYTRRIYLPTGGYRFFQRLVADLEVNFVLVCTSCIRWTS